MLGMLQPPGEMLKGNVPMESRVARTILLRSVQPWTLNLLPPLLRTNTVVEILPFP